VLRGIRLLGTLLIVGGVLTVVWALVVWQWQDPFTALYTTYEQHQLSSSYSKRLASYHPVPLARPRKAGTAATPSPVALEKAAIAADARIYRRTVHAGDALGRIKVPRLGLDAVLVTGTDHDSLTKGPGCDTSTYLPGQGQLIYIAGHRTTYLAPFSDIDTMRPGDLVTIELPYATFVYRVFTHTIVPADDVGRLLSHGQEVLALQACHPRFFATHRYIVYAEPVRVIPRVGRPYAVNAPTPTAGTA
jgi:sortase A